MECQDGKEGEKKGKGRNGKDWKRKDWKGKNWKGKDLKGRNWKGKDWKGKDISWRCHQWVWTRWCWGYDYGCLSTIYNGSNFHIWLDGMQEYYGTAWEWFLPS